MAEEFPHQLQLWAVAPPGFGKTRLLRKVRKFLEEEGYTVSGPEEAGKVRISHVRGTLSDSAERLLVRLVELPRRG